MESAFIKFMLLVNFMQKDLFVLNFSAFKEQKLMMRDLIFIQLLVNFLSDLL